MCARACAMRLHVPEVEDAGILVRDLEILVKEARVREPELLLPRALREGQVLRQDGGGGEAVRCTEGARCGDARQLTPEMP